MAEVMRKFEGGATRDIDFSKYEYAGFLSPQVLEAFGAYMHECRKTAEGLRASDNWQKGIPNEVYQHSFLRHAFDLWRVMRGLPTADGELGATMGVLFNVMGFVFERIKKDPEWLNVQLAKYKEYRAAELADRAKNAKV